MTETIDIENVGPVEYVSIPLPEGGGITVLRGRNESGKSLSLDAVGRMLGGSQQVEARDGHRVGEVRWGDLLLRVGKSTRRSGELEVLNIEGRMAIADLVEPRLKDPKAADGARTKALCRLTGAKADEVLFYDAVGGKTRFDDIVSPAATEGDDLVEMQRKIKRDFDLAARQQEDAAKKAQGEAKGADMAVEGLDLDAASDGSILQQRLEDAVVTQQNLINREQAANESAEKAAEATEASEKALAEYKGSTVADAEIMLAHAQAALKDADEREEQARKTYNAAREFSERAENSVERAADQLKAAKSHSETIAKWQATIDAGKIEGPRDLQIITAETKVGDARRAVEYGDRIRQAQVQIKRRDEARRRAAKADAEAITLREAGKDTEKVLAEVVEVPGLTLKDGRWCTEQPSRGQVYFADRSKGFRASMAVRLVAQRVRDLGEGTALIGIPQELWEGLDADNRKLVQGVCRELKVNAIALQADTEEARDLRAEVFEATTAAEEKPT